MSSSSNDYTLSPANWRTRFDNAHNTHRDPTPFRPFLAPRVSFRSALDDSGRGELDPWISYPDVHRQRTPHLSFSEPMVRIVGLENPRPIQTSFPHVMGQRNMRIPARQEDEPESRLSEEEQRKAVNKLRKEIYSPPPKKPLRRLSLYYREPGQGAYRDKDNNGDDDGKRCAVCLEDFEPKESVMLTPCDHMFHEDCIVPWVKANGQCPVCRFSLGERGRETASYVGNGVGALTVEDVFAGEFISLVRAMEEAFFSR